MCLFGWFKKICQIGLRLFDLEKCAKVSERESVENKNFSNYFQKYLIVNC